MELTVDGLKETECSALLTEYINRLPGWIEDFIAQPASEPCMVQVAFR